MAGTNNFDLLLDYNSSYVDVENQVYNFNTGDIRIVQRFNDKDTDPELLATYKSWGLQGHNGIDFVKIDGDNSIKAFFSGTVVFADWYYNLDWIEKNYFYGGGIMTFVKRDNANIIDVYMHLSNNEGINVGDRVEIGSRVGIQGGSGESQNQFPAHCHWYSAFVNDNNDIQNLNNGYYGGVNPLPELVTQYRELHDDKCTPPISTPLPSNTNNNQNLNNENMFKDNFRKEIPTQFEEPEITTINNAVTNGDAGYILTWGGSAARKEVKRLKVDVDTVTAKLNAALIENERLKKKSTGIKKDTKEQEVIQNLNSVQSQPVLSQKERLEKIANDLQSDKNTKGYGDILVENVDLVNIKSTAKLGWLVKILNSQYVTKWISKKFAAFLFVVIPQVSMFTNIFQTTGRVDQTLLFAILGTVSGYLGVQGVIDYKKK
jgi:hypothetical protein